MKNPIVSLTTIIIVLILLSVTLDAQTPTIKIGGYVQNWLILREGTEGIANAPAVYTSGFRIRRARLGFNGDLSELFSYKILLDFAGAQNVLLDFATTVKFDPVVNLTVGQFIAPTQMYETSTISSSNTECLDISEIGSMVTTTMNLDSYRDVGLMASGTVEMVKYGAYFGNGQGRFNYASNKSGIVSRKFGEGLVGGRIDIEPFESLIIGGHYARNKQESINGTSRKNLNRQSYSVVAGINDMSGLTIRAEYAGGKNMDIETIDSSFTGSYILFAYKFIPQAQVVFRYERMKETTRNPIALERATFVIGGTYFVTKDAKEIARIQLNYFARTESSPTPSKDNDLLLAGLQIKF
jgi:hypothetical protein